MENNQCLLLQYLSKRNILKPEELRNEMSLQIRKNYSRVEEPIRHNTRAKNRAKKRFQRIAKRYIGYYV